VKCCTSLLNLLDLLILYPLPSNSTHYGADDKHAINMIHGIDAQKPHHDFRWCSHGSLLHSPLPIG
jgi:hypothetical protein